MWLYGKTYPQSYPVDFSILRLGLNKDEHPFRCVLLSCLFSPMLSMSRGVINCAKLFFSNRFSRIKSFD